MDRQLLLDLSKKHGQNVLEAEKEYVALNGPFTTPEARQQFRDAYGFNLAQPGAAPGVAPAAQAAQPTAPRPAAGPSMAQQAAASRPVTPAAPSAITVPLAQQQAAAAAAKTQATTEAEAAGKDIGQLRANIGKAERNADYLLTKIDELFIDDKAFRDSVGIKGAGLGFGILNEPVAGTKEADWMARFAEVQGQQFIQGIELLKNTGAITDREGQAARAAISRMSQAQSEKEFRKAAKDFQDVIKRGVDASRGKLGQEPKYGTKPASELAAKDRQALEWANSNPNDPRAAEIKRRLGQ
jgi:hypothetical protein